MKTIILCIFVSAISVMAVQLKWQNLFPEIKNPVYDLQKRSIHDYANMHFLALPVLGEGMAVYQNLTEPVLKDSLIGIYNYGSLGVISVALNETNPNEVFCALGSGSYSDGLYLFNIDSLQFDLIQFASNPNFIKKLPSGYYLGYIYGLMHSEDGVIWTDIEYFEGINVTRIAEDKNNNIIVSSGTTLFINNGVSFTAYDTDLPVRDLIFDEWGDQFGYEIFKVSISEKSYTDGIYKVNYNAGEITGLELIEYIYNCNLMCNYGYGFAVTLLGSNEIRQIGDDTGIDISPISDKFEEIFVISPYYNTVGFVIGTDKGVFEGEYTSGIDVNSVPLTTILHKNYPNPFNPVTQIKFDLTKTAKVRLSVFNVNGQLISELVSGIKNAGHHSVEFDGSRLNSGVYYYTLEVAGKSLTKKMILMK